MPAFDKDGSLIMGICNDRDINTRQQLREQLSTAKALATDYKVKALKCGQHWKPDIIAEAARSKKRLETSLQGGADGFADFWGDGYGQRGDFKTALSEQPRKKVFVRINCGAISPELIESELFGYEKATFTGTNNSGKLGRFGGINLG